MCVDKHHVFDGFYIFIFCLFIYTYMYDLHLTKLEHPKREPTDHQPTITVFRKKSFATLHRIRAGSPAELRDVLLAETYLGR